MSLSLLITEGTGWVKILSRETNYCHWSMFVWAAIYEIHAFLNKFLIF